MCWPHLIIQVNVCKGNVSFLSLKGNFSCGKTNKAANRSRGKDKSVPGGTSRVLSLSRLRFRSHDIFHSSFSDSFYPFMLGTDKYNLHLKHLKNVGFVAPKTGFSSHMAGGIERGGQTVTFRFLRRCFFYALTGFH